jgi:T1SS-143 domain-containing protein
MSIEDLNVSAIDTDQAVTEFSSEFQADGQQAADFEMAQATDNGASAKSDRLPAEATAVSERPKEIVPDQNNIARLPADVTVDEIRVDGANLILVQADGTEVTIINGALRIPTFIIGDVEVPQQVLLAVLEQDGVNVAAGPDGSYSATNSGPQSSGGDFEDSLQQSTEQAGPLAALLANTEFGDPNGDGNGLLFDDTPIITDTALSFVSETANADGTFENQIINGVFGFVPGADTGQIASIAYVNTLNMDEPTQTGIATALTSGGVAVVVTVSADGLTLTGTAGGTAVFILTVTDTATGAFNFQQLQALDHPDQGQSGADDLLRLQFTYTVTDKDGDTVIGNASIDIGDDGPVAGTGTGSTVEDEAVNGGNNEEADGFAASVSGVSLNINWGADSANAGGVNDRSVAFTNTTVAVSGANGESLTSLGMAVKTVLINGVLVGYTGETAPTAVTGEGSSNVVFFASVSDAANGSYDFTLVKPLDHAAGDGSNGENSLSLTFNYTATDSDGDKSSSTFTVNVIDDAPVANAGTGSTVEEEAVNGGNNEEADGFAAAVSGVSLNINWGADSANAGGVNDRSVAFTNTTIAVSGANGAALTSLGLAVSTVLINGVLVGYTGETAPTAVTGEGSSNVVFFASVSDAANGSYDFTLVKPLDHAAGDGSNGENSLSLTFNYTATDSDGDTSSNTFTVNVIDDAPVANAGTGSTVEDEAVNGGNNEETDGFATAVSGVSLNINWGADSANAGGANDRSVAFTNTTVAVSGANGAALTSLGLAVSTVLINGVLVGYTGETAPTAVTGEGSGNVVFFASVSDAANGSYDFTLVKPLDHAAGDGTNGENSLSLTFNYTATDSDGDKSSSTFTVNIIDDVPVRGEEVRGTVEDEAVNGGNNENDGLTAVATGALNIRWGADNADSDLGGNGDRSVAFTNTTVAVSGANGATLTSLGLTVSTVLINGVLVGYTGSTAPSAINGANVVFHAALSDDNSGAYTFTLVKPLDHAAGDGTNGENSLSLTFGYTARDSDGDSVTGSFRVDVSDDVARIGTPFAGGVVEEEQSQVAGNGNEDGSGSGDNDGFLDLNRTTHQTGGTLAISWGSDNANDGNGQPGDRSVQFGPAAVANLTTLNLTSDGDAIKYTTITVSGQQILLAYTGATAPTAVPANSAAALAASIVFSVALSDGGNGSYAFTLYDTLDHQGSVQGEDSQTLTFQFTATDSDGDTTAPASFSVSVIDDKPVAIGTILPRFVEEEELSGGNEDTTSDTFGADADFSIFGQLVDVTGKSAGGPLNIFWGGDDGNKQVNGGYTGSQVAGDLSVVFADGTGAARVLTATQAGEFLSISGGAGSVALGALTSAGQPVTFSLSANGTVLTASAGGQAVFTVTLSDTGSGSYDFNLTGVLDHPVKASGASNEDILSFTFTFTARDGDGDIVKDTFKVNVIDDVPVRGEEVRGTVEDEAVNGGNNENDGLTAVATGALNIRWGADNADSDLGGNGDRSVAFTNTTVAVSGANGATLTSLGLTVSTVLINGVLVGYTGSTAPSAINGANVVFHAALSDDNSGAYTFTLVKPLDHAAGDGTNGENSLSLTFGYTARDSDGDSVTGSFRVDVSDDVARIGTPFAGGVVEEEQSQVAGNGNEDGSGSGDNDGFLDLNRTTHQTGGTLAISWGSDNANDGNGQPGDRSVQFGPAAVANLTTLNLTSDGDAIKYTTITVSGQQILLAYTGATAPTAVPANSAAALAASIVFSVALSDGGNGSYAFTLYDTLDHQGSVQGEDSQTLTFQFTATDSDGDTTAPASFSVSVIDDKPVAIGTILPRFVEEEELSGGNEDTTSDTFGADADFSIFGQLVDVTGKSAGGPLNIFWGGDDGNKQVNGGYTGSQVAGDLSVVFADGTGAARVLTATQAGEFLSISGGAGSVALGALTSAGQPVTFSLSANGTVLTASAGGQAVFTVTLSDTGSGSYDFNLTGVLDHPVKASGASNEDILSFTFTFTARDGDGDIVKDTFKVNVIDDVPVLTGPSIGVTVDEDDILNLRSEGTSPNDGTADGSSSELALLGGGFAATVSGSVASTVAFGADGQRAGGGFSFTSDALATLNGLGLTSKGGAIVFAVVGDAIVGYVNGAFGGFQPVFDRPVMSLDLNETTGAFTFRQYDQLDHAAGNGQNTTLANGLASINFGAVINATDGDGDVVNLSGKLLITVRDDVPEVSISTTGSVTIDESTGNQNDDTTSNSVRNLFNGVTVKGSDADMGGAIYARHDVVDTSVNGGTDDTVTSSLTLRIDNAASGLFTTEGQAITLSLEGGLVVGRIASGAAAFAVAIQPNGDVSVAQYLSVKHPNTGSNDEAINLAGKISAVITATDHDGDVVSKSVSIGDKISFEDDGPRVFANTLLQIDEDVLSGGNPGGSGDDVNGAALTGTLAHDGGADSTASVLWSSAGLTLPSGFWFSVSTDGTVMTITQLQGGVYVPVVTATITNTATGAYSVAPIAPIDHPQGTIPGSEDNVQFTISYDVTDGDGDQARGTLSINVDDDTPTVAANAVIVLDDDALSGGNPGGTGDDAENAILTGVLSHSGGADGTASVLWASNGLTLPNGFWYDLSADSKTMTITQQQNGTYVGVFKVVVTDPATGAYQVIQLAAVDHNTAGTEDNLQVSFQYRVTDGDGDVATGTLTLNVDDDTPTLTQTLRYNDVYEAGVGAATGTDNSTFAVAYGADGYGATAFTGALKLDIGGGLAGNVNLNLANGADSSPKFTSEGRVIVFTMVDANTIRGFAGNELIIEIKLTDTDSSAKTTLYGNIDHIAAQDGAAIDKLVVDATVKFTDGDGDAVTGIIRSTIHDEAPVAIGPAQTGTLSEAGLPLVSSTFASLNIDIGADNKGTHVGIGMNGGVPIINTGLTSDGVPLQYIVRTTNGVDQELVAFKQGDTAANPVFIVAVLHPGSFAATLYQNIDHPAGNGPLTLNMSARVYDGDGDFVDQPFTINIADDVPELVSGAAVSGDVGEGTVVVETLTFASGAVDLRIPGNGTGGVDSIPIVSTILVPAGGTILDLNVSINLVHTFMADLEITLIAPDGTRVRLVNDNGGGGDPDGVMTFDDEALNGFPSTNAGAPFVGTWRPAIDMLSMLDGKTMSGTWRLEIKDDLGADTGTLRNWSLQIESEHQTASSSTTVDLSPLVDVGADDINGGAAFALKTITMAENLGTVTAGGQQVKIVSDGTTLTGYAANDPATPLFTLKVSATGIATFVLIGELDHGAGNDTLKLDLSAYVQARDGDGDTVTLAAGQFSVNVADSLPTAIDVAAAMTENESKSVTLVEGVHFNFGADEINTAVSVGTPSYTGLPLGVTLGTPGISFDTANNKISIVPGTAFDALAAGQTVVVHIPYTVADGDGDTVTKDIAITITGTNDIPVIDLSTTAAGNDTTTNAVEQLPQQFAWQADLSDVDSPNLQSMKLTLGNIQDATAETLSLNATATAAAAGLTVSYDAATGIMQITGSASVNRYETILKNIVYLNSSDNPHVALDRTVTVIVNDGLADSAPQVATIHLIAINDAPVLAGTLTETVAEGGSVVLTLAKLGYSDVDDNAAGVTFQVSNLSHGTITNGGASATSFTAAELIAGLIKFNHDGSEGSTASFNVKVEDGNEDGSVPVVGTFNLAVTQVNDLPIISSGSTGSEAENAPIANVVYQTVASDLDPGATLTYSLTGADASLFTISSTGAVTFKASPNFEAPADAGGNNVYDIIVNVTDGVSPAVTKAVAISVTNVNEAPVITSGATGSQAENAAISNVVYQAVASDPEGVALTYTLTGADANLFNISATGAVTFKVSPNFEVPADAGGNNVYNFTVNASDGINPAATKDVAITVTDVVENTAPVGAADRIFTNASNFGPGTAVEFDHAWLLSNDTDANGDSLTINSYSWTPGSGVQIVSSGAFDNGNTQVVVDLNDGASGSFNYAATDGIASTGTVTVAVQRSSNNDLILGGSGDDILIDARSSEAVLDGRGGRDYIIGGNSDNTIVGDQNDHLINGGGGTDTVSVGSSFTSSSNAQIVNVERFTLTSATTLNLSNQSEGFKILGSSDADTITGGGGNDTINAGGGNDTITLSAANSDQDQIRFATNTGSDTVNGFIAGKDKIAFLAGNGSGAVDFDDSSGSSAGTTLDEDDFEKVASIATITSSLDDRVIVITTAQTEAQILAATDSANKSYVVVYNSTAGAAQIWFDTNWNSGGAASRSLVATLNGVTAAQVAALTRADFVAYNSATDPIILDLDNNGFAFSSIGNGVTFDINADGKADKVAWTSKDGILAYDVDGNGKIDNGSEIFTPSFAGGNHAGGVAALATLDSNGDGKIDAGDDAFSRLSIWIDANNNGISDEGELSSLADHRVASISLDATPVDGQDDGQSVLAEGTFTFDDGSNGHFIEVGFDTIVGDGSFGTAGDDILAGGLAHMTMTGGAGADTFVLDADAFNGIALADVIADYKDSEGDVLDVSSLLTSLLGHEASEADALASVKTTVNGADTIVSVNGNGSWHDVAVLQDYTSTVKVLYDDDHNATAASHSV